MTPKEIQIALLLKLGYVWTIYFKNAYLADPNSYLVREGRKVKKAPEGMDTYIDFDAPSPERLKDMWELEEAIPDEEKMAYYDQVYEVVAEDCIEKGEKMVRWDIYHATPMQRARAWLRWMERREEVT